MTRFSKRMIVMSNLSKAGAGLMLLYVGAACSSSPEVASSTDAGDNGDGGSTSGGASSSGGGTSSGVGGSSGGTSSSSGVTSTNGGGATDAAGALDGYDPTDEGGVGSLAVNLGTAGNFAVLAKSGVSTVPTSAITGNLGVSPAAATYITGFGLIADSTNVFSTSPQVTGKVYASNYTPPTPSNLTTAVSDMQLAFTDAAGRPPNVTELGAGNIGGMTLSPGVYKWSSGLLIPTSITLAGGATAVWIFQVAQNLTVSNAATVTLTGGALPKNIFWQVSGSVTLGTTAHLEGVILGKTAITLQTGASINGRLLAQTAVSVAGSTVVQPAP
jgi:Ice-binding-like